MVQAMNIATGTWGERVPEPFPEQAPILAQDKAEDVGGDKPHYRIRRGPGWLGKAISEEALFARFPLGQYGFSSMRRAR